MILKSYFLKKKNLLLFTIFFSITILFTIVMVTYKEHIKLKLNVEINNKIENRTLLIGSDDCNEYDCIGKNLNKDKIISFYNYIPDFYGNNLNFGTALFKEGILEMLPKVEEGNSFNNDSKNSVIIPKYINSNGKIIETSHYLNNNISFTINQYNEQINYNSKIVGIYNNEKNIEDKAIIYYSYNDSNLFNSKFVSPQLIVILKDEEYMPSYIEYLDNNNYYYNYFDSSKLKELNSYKSLYRLVSLYEVLVLLIIGSVVLIFIFMIINDQRYNIALKKAIGHTNNKIGRTLISELIYYFTFIYLFLIVFISIFIINFDVNILINILFRYITLYILTILEIFVAYIITANKLRKIQIIDLLKQ